MPSKPVASPEEMRATIAAGMKELDQFEQKTQAPFYEGMTGLMTLAESLRKEAADLRRIGSQIDEVRALRTSPLPGEPVKRAAERVVSTNEALVHLGSDFEKAADTLDGLVASLRAVRRKEMDAARDYGAASTALADAIEPEMRGTG